MTGYKKMTDRERKEFRAAIKPLLIDGKKNFEIADILNKRGWKLPGGRPVTKSCVALHATAVMRRKATAKGKPRPQKSPNKSTVPVTGRLGQISDILTLPGLSENTKLAVIKALANQK